TSASIEDHVSMSAHASRKAGIIATNVEMILAIELLVAVEALEQRRPLRSGAAIEEKIARFREVIPHRSGDRSLSEEMALARDLIRAGFGYS
ncbi:MAG: aromatic amino acid lyase, partial [Planctomycetota bacterium]